MDNLLTWQYIAIGILFVWSGFVRSGLGFGGAVLSLPFLLLVHNDALVFLPIIAVHLLIFSSWIAWRNQKSRPHGQEGTIDWQYLGASLRVMIIPKLIGVFGLLTLPTAWMTSLIFVIVAFYAVGYIRNRPFQSRSRAVDNTFLALGGYISGASLIGAPLIVAVYAGRVAKESLRDTLFVLWFILVLIKCAAFVWAGVDFQLIHHLWLLPCATLGHVLGSRFHRKLVTAETPVFFRVLGSVLLVVSLFGLVKAWW